MSEYLALQANQFAPLASGVPFQPLTGLEGIPGGNTPAAMLLQPLLSGLMSRVGMFPGGLHDRNLYDMLQSQRFWQMQQEMQRHMAELDRERWMNGMRGVAHMTGTPWGAEQMRAARSLSDLMVGASPFLQILAPDLLDEMAGARGSAAVLGGRTFMAGRYLLDPITGRLGQDPASAAAIARGLYDQGVGLDQGFRAGQVGQIYEQMVYRGMLAVPTTGVASLSAQLGQNPLAALSDTQTLGALASFDPQRTRRSLEQYLSAINAVRDIFGEGAPMSQLFGALEKLSNGSLSQLQPGRLASMVRTTSQLANLTGVGLDNAIMLQDHVSTRVARMGLDPVFAVDAAQHALAFGGAFRATGFGNHPAWGRASVDQLTAMDAQLTAGAAGSRAAQRMGLVLRLAESAGGFAAGSDAARYAEALKQAQVSGLDYWTDSAGNSRPLNLSAGEFNRVIGNAPLAGGGQVGLGMVENMLNQRHLNLETVQRFGLADVARRGQWASDIRPWLASQLQGYFAGTLPGGISGAQATTIAERLRGLDPDVFADNAQRSGAMAGIFREVLGANLGGQNAQLLASGFYGFWDQAVRNDPNVRGLGSAQNMFALFNPRLTEQTIRIQQQAAVGAQIQGALSPLNRGGFLQRMSTYLQNMPEGDPASWVKAIATSLGGVSVEDVQNTLVPQIAKIRDHRDALEDLQNQLSASKDPTHRKHLYDQIQSRIRALDTDVQYSLTAVQGMGLDRDMIDGRETQRAIALGQRTLDNDEKLRKALGDSAGEDRKKRMADFFTTNNREFFRDTARARAQAGEDVALRLVMSDTEVKRFGEAGVTDANIILQQAQKLRVLAAIHAGGDIGALAEIQDPAVAAQVKQIVATQDEAVRRIEALRTQGGSAGDEGAALAAAQVIRRRHGASGEGLARELLSSYGFNPDEAGGALSSVGRLLGSARGQGMALAFMGSNETLARIAQKNGLSGAGAIDLVDQLYNQYQTLGAAGFESKYGREAAEAMALQVKTGMIHLGREYDLSGKGLELLQRQLSGGQLSVPDSASKVPDKIEISGTLQIVGDKAEIKASSGGGSAGIVHNKRSE